MHDFQEAKAAVAKIMKDYQPLVNLIQSLDAVEKAVQEIGNLEKVKEALLKDIQKCRTDVGVAKEDLAVLVDKTNQAQVVYDEIVAKLNAFRGGK